MRHTRELGLYGDQEGGVTVLRLYDKCGHIPDVPGLGIHSFILQLLRALLTADAVLFLGSVAVGLLEDTHYEKMRVNHLEVSQTSLEVYEGVMLNYQVQPYNPLAIRGNADWLETAMLRQLIVEHAILVVDRYTGPWPIDGIFSQLQAPTEADILAVMTQYCRGIWFPVNDGWTLVHVFRSINSH